MNNTYKTKYIFALCTLIALTEASCWSAAPDEQQIQPIALVQQIDEANERDDFAGARQLAMTITLEELEKLPDEVIAHIAESLDPSSWVRMAFKSRRLNGIVRSMPLYKLVQPHLAQNGGDLQATFFDAVIKNYPGASRVINYLIRQGVNINAQNVRDEHKKTALMETAYRGHEAIAAQLIQANADVNATDRWGDTALKYAVRNSGNVEIIRMLINHKADIHALDLNGDTLLMIAAGNGNVEAVKMLIDSGANVNVINRHGYTALMEAAYAFYNRNNRNNRNYVETVRTLLNSNADKTPIGTNGRTALDIAIQSRDDARDSRNIEQENRANAIIRLLTMGD